MPASCNGSTATATAEYVADSGLPCAVATGKLQVTYFQRKRRPNANFSLEFIFDDIRARLKHKIQARVRIAPVRSNGLLRRVWIWADALFHQGQINHVTGDTNFVAIGLSPKRTVLTILDCGFVTRTRGVRRWILKKFWLDLPVRSATVVTTISEAARNEIISWSNCDPAKVVAIPVAVSDSFQPVPKAFNATCPRILQIGTAANKNLARSIEALAGISCVLVVVGALAENLRARLHELGIVFENFVNLSSDELLRQYHLADMVLFPSTSEGFGMPIVEAQRVGRPVVTSNTSSMPEVAGTAAAFVDPLSIPSIREGVLRIIHDEPFRRELILHGYSNARRFDGQEIALRYLRIYESLL